MYKLVVKCMSVLAHMRVRACVSAYARRFIACVCNESHRNGTAKFLNRIFCMTQVKNERFSFVCAISYMQ